MSSDPTDHSMSSDPAKSGFFIWPSLKFMKFHTRGKISGFWDQQCWNFFNWACISKSMSIWNWCFSRKLDQKIFGILLLEFYWLLLVHFRIFSFNIVKCKVLCWIQQGRKFFTYDLWTLVRCCYKTCFWCAFKHDI